MKYFIVDSDQPGYTGTRQQDIVRVSVPDEKEQEFKQKLQALGLKINPENCPYETTEEKFNNFYEGKKIEYKQFDETFQKKKFRICRRVVINLNNIEEATSEEEAILQAQKRLSDLLGSDVIIEDEVTSVDEV